MKSDGGPAFPSHGSMGEVIQEGMTLRDWFAGQTMIAIIQQENELAKDSDKEGVTYYNDWGPMNENVAYRVYWFADAMLAEREKRKR